VKDSFSRRTASFEYCTIMNRSFRPSTTATSGSGSTSSSPLPLRASKNQHYLPLVQKLLVFRILLECLLQLPYYFYSMQVNVNAQVPSLNDAVAAAREEKEGQLKLQLQRMGNYLFSAVCLVGILCAAYQLVRREYWRWYCRQIQVKWRVDDPDRAWNWMTRQLWLALRGSLARISIPIFTREGDSDDEDELQTSCSRRQAFLNFLLRQRQRMRSWMGEHQEHDQSYDDNLDWNVTATDPSERSIVDSDHLPPTCHTMERLQPKRMVKDAEMEMLPLLSSSLSRDKNV